MRSTLERHDALLRKPIESTAGKVVKTMSDGIVCAALRARKFSATAGWSGPVLLSLFYVAPCRGAARVQLRIVFS
jgi:hypothetical protein